MVLFVPLLEMQKVLDITSRLHEREGWYHNVLEKFDWKLDQKDIE